MKNFHIRHVGQTSRQLRQVYLKDICYVYQVIVSCLEGTCHVVVFEEPDEKRSTGPERLLNKVYREG